MNCICAVQVRDATKLPDDVDAGIQIKKLRLQPKARIWLQQLWTTVGEIGVNIALNNGFLRKPFKKTGGVAHHKRVVETTISIVAMACSREYVRNGRFIILFQLPCNTE